MVTKLAKLRRELNEQEVLQSELESLKANKKVYENFPGSGGHICFITSKAKVLSNCKEKQEKLRRQVVQEEQKRNVNSSTLNKEQANSVL